MPKITYVAFDGASTTVEVAKDLSVMEGAKNNNIDGIAADCGGSCACATCHVYVDPGFAAKLPPASEMELGLLDAVGDRRETSRLSCQITVTADLEGMVVHMPESQYA
jgi:2Fe-2S ferredoxin